MEAFDASINHMRCKHQSCDASISMLGESVAVGMGDLRMGVRNLWSVWMVWVDLSDFAGVCGSKEFRVCEEGRVWRNSWTYFMYFPLSSFFALCAS